MWLQCRDELVNADSEVTFTPGAMPSSHLFTLPDQVPSCLPNTGAGTQLTWCQHLYSADPLSPFHAYSYKSPPTCGPFGLTPRQGRNIIVVMRSKNEHRNTAEATSYRELRLLSEVHHNSAASQRDLSKRVGIALGLTNVLLRNLASKGYVRVTKAGWKRWLYALTPAGLSRRCCR